MSDWLDRRWTVNLPIPFTDLPPAERPAAAAALGFDAAERPLIVPVANLLP